MPRSHTKSSSSDNPVEKPVEFKCLILEDDAEWAGYLGELIEMEGGAFVICSTLRAAREAIDRQPFDLMFLDQMLPDGAGSDFFYEIHEKGCEAIAIMMTGELNLPNALELTRRGLFNYMTKPARMKDIQECLKQARRHIQAPRLELEFPNFIAESQAMRDVRSSVKHAAEYRGASVLLTGETGVGKDVVARLIHRISVQRRSSSGEIVALNCANLPSEMFEAELFGVEKGAFTGAVQSRQGLAEAASDGTLFLDEVAELNLGQQAKLLQFLETGEFRRLGDNRVRKFAGRIIAATNKPLHQEVEAGNFREDLVYRIDVFNIKIPPLRQRMEDLEGLCEILLSGLAEKYERSRLKMEGKDLAALQAHDFPGNVRELRNLLERSFLRTPKEAEWLRLDSSWLREAKRRNLETDTTEANPSTPSPERKLGLLEAQEYELIGRVLREEAGVIRRAADRLGISSQALLRRLAKWPELRP